MGGKGKMVKCKGNKTTHFVYISFLDGSDKFYIGKHSCNCLDCSYVGSGAWIRDCLGAGRKFRREIIFEFASNEDALKWEKIFIDQMKKRYPKRCMNFQEWNVCGTLGRKMNEEQRKQNSERQKGRVISQETRERMSKAKLGVKKSEETRKRMSLAMTGKAISEETKAKLREARKNQYIPYEKLASQKGKFRKWIVCLRTGMVFHGIRAAAEFWGRSESWIRQLCDGRGVSSEIQLEYMN